MRGSFTQFSLWARSLASSLNSQDSTWCPCCRQNSQTLAPPAAPLGGAHPNSSSRRSACLMLAGLIRRWVHACSVCIGEPQKLQALGAGEGVKDTIRPFAFSFFGGGVRGFFGVPAAGVGGGRESAARTHPGVFPAYRGTLVFSSRTFSFSAWNRRAFLPSDRVSHSPC